MSEVGVHLIESHVARVATAERRTQETVHQAIEARVAANAEREARAAEAATQEATPDGH